MKKIFIYLILFTSLLVICGCRKKDTPPNNNTDCIHENKTWDITKEATCTEIGSKQQKCTDCDEILTTAIIQMISHEVVIDKKIDATCEQDGLTEGSHCKNCNVIITKQEVISHTGHNYLLDEILSTPEKSIYVCHCGNSYEKVNEEPNNCTQHITSEWIIINDSTCEKLGEKQKICTNCNIVLEISSISMKDHVESKIEKIEPKCGVTGLSEGIYCSECEKILKAQTVIDALEHVYVITNTKNPTQDEKGYIEYTCTLCNDTYQKELEELGKYNPSEATLIMLDDSGIVVTNDNGGVVIVNNIVEITLPGEYDIIGTILEGSIKVSLTETERATLNLRGVSITSSINNPISIESGDEVDVVAKVDTENYIYDKRVATSTDDTGAAIYAKTDLDIKGKGTLNIESTYNNGISTTKDLKIKNLILNVNAPNNAIKGNDSITIESGTIKAVSSSGDALKTEHSDISSSGKQRGIIHIIDGKLDLYAACDGIDASYEVIVDGGEINIYTEKYSNYSGDVSIPQSSIIYLRLSSRIGLNGTYLYSAQFLNDSGEVTWINGTLDSSTSSRYYKFNVPSGAKYIKYFIYSTSQTQGQSTNYLYATDQLTISDAYDTYYVSRLSSTLMSGDWTNYSTNTGPGGNRPGGGMGPGGMQEGNPDSALYSCKGIKADNDIIINGGIINISSHDDAIHTNSDVLLETGSYGSATLTINGGTINITTDDDGIHADGTLTINGGDIVINKSYEGIEGNYIYFKGGNTQIKSSDDGINAKSTLYFQGGVVYLDANGDGIDSNGSVYMSGGIVLALGPTNGGNGVIDIGDRGYTFSFTGGILLAIGCSGMDVSPTGSSGTSVSASRVTSSLNSYLNVISNGETIAVLKVTKYNQTYRVFAYNSSEYSSLTLTTSTTTSVALTNGLYYTK